MEGLLIVDMEREMYKTIFGYDYECGILWDYPLEELDYLQEEHEGMIFARLDDGRLYETDMGIEEYNELLETIRYIEEDY